MRPLLSMRSLATLSLLFAGAINCFAVQSAKAEDKLWMPPNPNEIATILEDAETVQGNNEPVTSLTDGTRLDDERADSLGVPQPLTFKQAPSASAECGVDSCGVDSCGGSCGISGCGISGEGSNWQDARRSRLRTRRAKNGFSPLFGGLFSGNFFSNGPLSDGLFLSSDHCFDDFISPMTNPTMFEDPRTLSEIRPIFIDQDIPSVLGGSDIGFTTLQIRVALTERLSLVSTKNGYFDSDSAVVGYGAADFNVGLKWNFYRDVPEQTLVSLGVSYEFSSGDERAREGNGDGEIHAYLSAATIFGDDWRWMFSTGVKAGLSSDQSSLFYLSNHIDRQLVDNWYVLWELNVFVITEDGPSVTSPGVSGGDLFNFGSIGVEGNTLSTTAIGLKYKPSVNWEFGVAYEVPVSSRKGILDNRLTADIIWRF